MLLMTTDRVMTIIIDHVCCGYTTGNKLVQLYDARSSLEGPRDAQTENLKTLASSPSLITAKRSFPISRAAVYTDGHTMNSVRKIVIEKFASETTWHGY